MCIAILITFGTIWRSAVALLAHNQAVLGHSRSCSIASNKAILLRSARMLLCYHCWLLCCMLKTIDTVWLIVVLRSSCNCTSYVSC